MGFVVMQQLVFAETGKNIKLRGRKIGYMNNVGHIGLRVWNSVFYKNIETYFIGKARQLECVCNKKPPKVQRCAFRRVIM